MLLRLLKPSKPKCRKKSGNAGQIPCRVPPENGCSRDHKYTEFAQFSATIQNRCNHLEVNLLISQDLKDLLPWQGSKLVPEHKGDLLIKGKMVNLPLYTVNAEVTAAV